MTSNDNINHILHIRIKWYGHEACICRTAYNVTSPVERALTAAKRVRLITTTVNTSAKRLVYSVQPWKKFTLNLLTKRLNQNHFQRVCATHPAGDMSARLWYPLQCSIRPRLPPYNIWLYCGHYSSYGILPDAFHRCIIDRSGDMVTIRHVWKPYGYFHSISSTFGCSAYSSSPLVSCVLFSITSLLMAIRSTESPERARAVSLRDCPNGYRGDSRS